MNRALNAHRVKHTLGVDPGKRRGVLKRTSGHILTQSASMCRNGVVGLCIDRTHNLAVRG